MKKIVLSIIVALIAITANAQVYVGGTFGVGSDKVETEGEDNCLIINKVLNIKFNLHSYLFLCLLARFLRNSAFILAAPDPCNPVI